MSVVRALMRKGAQVTVYIQHEDTANQIGSAFQARRITSRVRGLKGDLGKRFSEYNKLLKTFQTLEENFQQHAEEVQF